MPDTFQQQLLQEQQDLLVYGQSSVFITPKVKGQYMAEPEQFYNLPLSKVVGFRNGLHSGAVGLEIEVEGKKLFKSPFKWWVCHSDGSLRDTDGEPAVEYVLKNPLDFEDISKALEYLESQLANSGSSVVNSGRTSVHVHVNCQKMTVRQLYRFICLYLVFEELLVAWSGPDREGNLFCLRAKDSEYYVQMLESVLKKGNFNMWKEDLRYSACNVASVLKFGSLEFRSLKGTVDVKTIKNWVQILLTIRDQAAKYDNPIEIVEDFNNLGPLPFFRKIFSEDRLRDLFSDVQGVSGLLWSGLRIMKDVAYACEWKSPQKKKEQEHTQDPGLNQYSEGSWTETPFGLLVVRSTGARISSSSWRVRDTWESVPYILTLEPGQQLLYLVHSSIGGDYLRLEVLEQ